MLNLWAEFDNELSPADSAGRVQHPLPPRRRPTEQAILSSLRDWLLHDYIVPYARSLAATRIFRRCYWIDGLGGNPNLQPLGSIAQSLAKETKPITLRVLALEARSSKRKEPKTEHNISMPKDSGTLRASWPEAAPALLQAIDQSAAIFLLNPFASSTPFSYEDLSSLYQRTAPTELCMLISYKQIEARLLPFLRTSDGASAFTALLRSDRWKALLTTDAAVDGLIDAFLASIQQHFLSAQRIALSMQAGRALVAPVPYTLLFATRRQDSLACMNDAVCLHRRSLYEASHRGVLTEEWFMTQQREQHAEEMQHLYQRILAQGRVQRSRRWPDLRQQLLIAQFGQFTVQDYDEIICKLLQNREVRCEWRRQSLAGPENEEHRIPGNDDILLWK